MSFSTAASAAYVVDDNETQCFRGHVVRLQTYNEKSGWPFFTESSLMVRHLIWVQDHVGSIPTSLSLAAHRGWSTWRTS